MLKPANVNNSEYNNCATIATWPTIGCFKKAVSKPLYDTVACLPSIWFTLTISKLY